MEQKLVRVPFDVELAKEIMDKKIEGRIFDNHYKCPARIVDFNFQTCKGKLNVVISKEIGKEVFAACNDEGTIFLEKEGKFDEKPTFMLDIPEYLTFKDGDVIYCEVNNGGGDYCKWLSIVKKADCLLGEPFLESYVEYNIDSSFRAGELAFDCSSDNIQLLRKATEFEKKALIDALKSNKKTEAQECLKRFFGIEEKSKYKFNPFDKVLVRNSEEMEWIPRFFERIAHCSESVRYITMDGNSWKYCIPYNEETEHLFRTTDDWEE